MFKPITDTISVQELLALREQGLSNREISERLDVAYNTVLKYIGRNPRKILENKAIKAEHDHKPVRLKTMSKVVELEGEKAYYKVDTLRKTVVVSSLESEELSHAEFLNLIKECQEVAEMLEG